MDKCELPEGWAWTTLGEITNTEKKRVRPQDYPHLPFVGMDNVESDTMRLLGTVPASEMSSNAEYFEPGDVLYGRLRPYLNKVFCANFEGLCSAEFIPFRKVPHLENRYLQYFLNSWEFVSFATHLNEGDRPRVRFEQLADYPFPLPPLPEQQRIVDEIEAQFTRLDAVVAALKRAQATLKRYRASVLTTACEGRFLPQDPTDEPASQLLERILTERRKQWNGRGSYTEPTPPDIADLPKLPVGWVWVTLSAITEKIGDVDHRMPKQVSSNIPYISTRDFFDEDKIAFDEAKTISKEDYEQLSRKIKPEGGDILLSRYGTVGKVRKVSTNRRFQASYSIAIIKTFNIQILTDYLTFTLRAEFVQKQISRDVRATAQPDLGLAHIREFVIPLPPLAEQQRIVEEVERRLSVMDEVEAALEANLKRAERLRQSILKRAFMGKLVPQNPADEPASALLERIREAKGSRQMGLPGY